MSESPDNLSITIKEYIERFLKIQTKDGQLIPLKLNDAQLKLYDMFAQAYNQNKPCKIIVLKARQLGISTATEAIIYALTNLNMYVSALIVAHESDASTNIFNMSKRYYDNLPPQLRPMIKYSNAKELRFENPVRDDKNPGLRSNIRVATAGKSGVGRSATFNFMHLSELAFWPEQDGQTTKDQLTGILQTLPQQGFSLLVIESTAKGYNYFKSLWDDAEAGKNDYIPLFFPWYEMQEYRRPWKGEEFTEEEKVEQEKYHLDNQQVMWRRYAIRNLCGGSIDDFHQEYPGTPEEAFILSGNPVFDVHKILARLDKVSHPALRGQFTEGGTWYDSDKGYIKIWEKPKAEHVYCIGADTAGDGSDYFVGYVLDKSMGGVQVASYRAETDEGLFVKQLYYLGYYYNYAMLAPECNFSSYPTMKLQEMGYLNMYVREAVDTYTNRIAKKFGFRTNSITRPLVIDMLADVIRERIDLINDEDFLREALSFIKNDRGRPEAAEGAHDDCVMAMAIAFYCMPQARSQMESSGDDGEAPVEDFSSFIAYGG